MSLPRPQGRSSGQTSRVQAPPSSRRLGAAPAAPPSRSLARAAVPAPASSRGMSRPGGSPPPQGGKKDNTPLIVGGVGAGVLVLLGLGIAMSGGKEKPVKKAPTKAVEKAPEPVKEVYDEWNDPSKLGSETDMAKKRSSGMKEQDKTGEVDRTK